MKSSSEDTKVRLDKWLWAARFFKTRQLATEAINGGHVHLNGARVKPARAVNLDDELTITKGPYQFVLMVKGLSGKRGPAKVAVTLYEETEASREKRELLSEQLRMEAKANPHVARRPDKKSRRQIIRFKNIHDPS